MAPRKNPGLNLGHPRIGRAIASSCKYATCSRFRAPKNVSHYAGLAMQVEGGGRQFSLQDLFLRIPRTLLHPRSTCPEFRGPRLDHADSRRLGRAYIGPWGGPQPPGRPRNGPERPRDGPAPGTAPERPAGLPRNGRERPWDGASREIPGRPWVRGTGSSAVKGFGYIWGTTPPFFRIDLLKRAPSAVKF